MTEKWQDEKWAEDIWYRGKVTRRSVVGWGAGAIGAAMLVPAPWRAAFGAAKPFKIGSEQPLSGAGAAGGKTAVVGLQMAADRINASGGVNGRPIELVIADDESSPAVARQKTEKLVQEDNIDLHVGGFLSNICLACMPVWEDAKIVNMISVCLDTTLTTTKCNRYSFRPYDYAPAQAVAFAPTLTKMGKKWHIAFADYSWGQSTRDAYISEIKKNGGEIVGTTGIPLGTPDMTPFLSKISGDFDGLFGIFFGKDGVTLVTQAYDLEVQVRRRRLDLGIDQPDRDRQQDRRLHRHQPLHSGVPGPARHAVSSQVLRRSEGAAGQDRSVRSAARQVRAVELRGHQLRQDRHGEVEVPGPRRHHEADRGARRPRDEGKRRLPARRQDTAQGRSPGVPARIHLRGQRRDLSPQRDGARRQDHRAAGLQFLGVSERAAVDRHALPGE
jgi:hypothetical protein